MSQKCIIVKKKSKTSQKSHFITYNVSLNSSHVCIFAINFITRNHHKICGKIDIKFGWHCVLIYHTNNNNNSRDMKCTKIILL
jgi:hypothetical protein